MIDWSKGLSTKHYAMIVDPYTWSDVSEVNILGGSVRYSETGERATADISCRSFDHGEEYWIRLYMAAKQEQELERVPLFTGIVSIPNISYNGKIPTHNLQCYSALSLAGKMYLPLGWYAGIGLDGSKVVKDLLYGYIPAPIVIDENDEDEPILSQSIIAENGETRLSMVDKIMEAINWRLILDGDGTIHIAPRSTDIVASFDYQSNDIIEMDVTVSNDWYNVPNVYRAISNNDAYTARDEDPNSRFSIQNRGREIWTNESSCALSNKETLADYAMRKLKEAQNVHTTLDYSRRFNPNVRISDYVEINYLPQNITGVFKVKSQSLTIGYGGHISEQAEGV